MSIECQRDGNAAIVTLNRPDKLNALTEDHLEGVAAFKDKRSALFKGR